MIIEQKIYDGSLLQDRFAYTFFNKKVLPIGNIVAFRAPMKVEEAFMVDREDLINKDFIYSEDAINFCIEIPNTDLFGGVCFQRLFNSHLATYLADEILKAPVEVDGDDIMVHKPFTQRGKDQTKGKASVSIAKQVNNAVLIHTGINIKAGDRAPDFAFSTNMTDEQAKEFMETGIHMFYTLVHDVFVATTKVIK